MTDILLYGAVTSAIYALLAVGFTLIFGVARIFNLGHGSFYALGAYAAYSLNEYLGLPVTLAVPLAALLVAAIGVGMGRLFIRPLRRSILAAIMITLGFALLVEQLLLLAYGSSARNVPPIVDGTVFIGAASISGQRVFALVAGIVCVAGLWIFIQRTRTGAAILAVSQDEQAAQYQGIPSNRVFLSVMGLSAGLAALAGALAGSFLTVQPDMGILAMVKSVAVVIVGGLGSLAGGIVAALVLGYSETIVSYYFSTRYTELVSLAAVLLTLSLRPSGLFGRRQSI